MTRRSIRTKDVLHVVLFLMQSFLGCDAICPIPQPYGTGVLPLVKICLFFFSICNVKSSKHKEKTLFFNNFPSLFVLCFQRLVKLLIRTFFSTGFENKMQQISVSRIHLAIRLIVTTLITDHAIIWFFRRGVKLRNVISGLWRPITMMVTTRTFNLILTRVSSSDHITNSVQHQLRAKHVEIIFNVKSPRSSNNLPFFFPDAMSLWKHLVILMGELKYYVWGALIT